MIVNMIEIINENKEISDYIYKFTIADTNGNIVKDYSQGISFADLWNEMDDDTKKQFAIKFIMENILR
jgi:hypothetical protein